MTEVTIRPGTLVILSGLPGSGKSHVVRGAHGLPMGAVVSSDALREQLLGTYTDLDERGELHTYRQESANASVFSIMRTIVRARLTEGFTTLVDSTNLTDAERKEWADIAQEFGAPVKVLILDTPLEVCLANNAQRASRVPAQVIHNMNQPPAPEVASQNGGTVTPPQGFMRSSKYPHEVITSDVTLRFKPYELSGENYDVIGDTHGLLDDLLALLKNAGWQYVEGHIRHPQGRKMLFLGDLVDRGPQSLEMLRFVKQAMADGVAEAIKGNHEKRLVKFYDAVTTHTFEGWRSFANAETGMALVQLPKEEAKALAEFMRALPPHKVLEDAKVAFVHGDIHRFDPFSTPSGDMVHGQSGFKKIDSDAEYQKRYDLGLNTYTMFRGHIPQTSVQKNIFSLERQSFQEGELVLMRLDAFLNGTRAGLTTQEAFEKSLLTQRCTFNFEAYSQKWELAKGMEHLVTNKLATRQHDDSGLLSVYKYSKQAFWNNSWDESEWLAKARGIVLNAGGDIVSHPFDKCFNYKENGAGLDLSDDEIVVVVDKLNGFLGIISDNPVRRADLLIHTQGGFGGDFVEYIKRYAHASPTRGALSRYLAKNDVTLMFEVLHPDDPHIIAYPEDMFGLHLIGVRGKGQQDQAWTEDCVDEVAAEMGLRRPSWTRMRFGELRSMIRDARTEGWMVRKNDKAQTHLLKIKTPYYLTTKFLGRLSKSKIAHMYGNPQNFKRTVDEEFYPIVDALVAQVSKDMLEAMSDTDRVTLVRELINTLQ